MKLLENYVPVKYVILILIIIGVILTILLVIIFYILYQRIRVKEDRKKGESGRIRSKQSIILSKFEVPVTYRTVKAQRPFLSAEKYGFEAVPANDTSVESSRPPSLDGGQPLPSLADSAVSYQLAVPQQTVNTQRRWSSTPDIATGEMTEAVRKRRKISQGVKEHLGIQGRRVSPVDLRGTIEGSHLSDRSPGHSPPGSVSGESAVSEADDQEAEVFSSTVIGAGKRRVGERRREASSKAKRTYKKSGKVSFTTSYNDADETLTVHLIRVFDIAGRKKSSSVNPFVRMYLLPGKQQKQTTRYKVGTKEPLYHEDFYFRQLEKAELEKHMLKIKVYNHGRVSKNEMLGEVDIALSSIDTSAKETFDVDLFKQRSMNSLAVIGLDVCHHAAFSKLQVIVKDVQDLPTVGIAGAPNPYVSVSLFREDTMDRKDTSTKRGTRNPIFQESLEFEVHADVQVPLTTYTLVVTVNHNSLVGKDEVIGHVIFSLDSPQRSAAEHWKDVQNGPHRHHERTHNLVDPDEI